MIGICLVFCSCLREIILKGLPGVSCEIPIHIMNILTMKIHNLGPYKVNSKIHQHEVDLYYILSTKDVKNPVNNNL